MRAGHRPLALGRLRAPLDRGFPQETPRCASATEPLCRCEQEMVIASAHVFGGQNALKHMRVLEQCLGHRAANLSGPSRSSDVALPLSLSLWSLWSQQMPHR